ncbi:hypothetical protein LSAT2_031011 [Lamellibrachia satsuma]|nr:hypothetical protein LSAT2_031011 [Lamellibrachia satsuma]
MTWAVPGYLPQHQLPAAIPDVSSPSPSPPANRRPEKQRLPTQCLRDYRGVALLVVFLAVAMISAIGSAIYLAGSELIVVMHRMCSHNPTMIVRIEERKTPPHQKQFHLKTDVTPTTASEAPSTSSMTETSTVTIPKPEETTTTASESPSVTTSTPSEPTGTTSVTRPTDVTPTTASEAPSTSSVTETSTVTTPKPDKTTSTAPYVTASEAPSVTTSTASKPTGTTSVMKPPEVTPTTASEAPTTSSVTETSTVTTPKPEETTTTVPENCTETTCQNNGTCDDTDGSPVCTCPNDYTGVRCESETEKCKDHTCENGGSCTNTDTGVDCTCPGNYTGDRCEKEKIPCSEVICQNGANCTDTDSGYRCDCPVNLTGLLCETVLTFCERETPCHNGGTCVDLSQNKYLCVCPKCECSAEKPLDNCTIEPKKFTHVLLWVENEKLYIYNTWKLTEAQRTVETMLERYADILQLKSNHRVNIFNLQRYRQETSGSVDEFMTRCKLQANKCQFRHAQETDERLVEQLIVGI